MAKEMTYDVPDYPAVFQRWLEDRACSMNALEKLSGALDLSFTRQWLSRVVLRQIDPKVSMVQRVLTTMKRYDRMLAQRSRRAAQGKVR